MRNKDVPGGSAYIRHATVNGGFEHCAFLMCAQLSPLLKSAPAIGHDYSLREARVEEVRPHIHAETINFSMA